MPLMTSCPTNYAGDENCTNGLSIGFPIFPLTRDKEHTDS